MPLSTNDVNRVMLVAETVSGNRAKALEWLEQPHTTFGGRTPMQMIAEGHIDNVIDYLHSIESGFAG